MIRKTLAILSLIGLLVILGFGGLGWHRIHAKSSSLDNLQELFDAWVRYGSQEEPQQTIAILVRKGIIGKDQTIDPISGQAFKFNNLIRAEDIARGGKVFGYSPLAKLLLSKRNGGAVVFTDGHAEWMYQESYENTLA